MCKPNKRGKGAENELGHRGFAKLRHERASIDDYREALVDEARLDMY